MTFEDRISILFYLINVFSVSNNSPFGSPEHSGQIYNKVILHIQSNAFGISRRLHIHIIKNFWLYKNGQPTTVTVHSHCVEKFEELLQRYLVFRGGMGCSSGLGKTNFFPKTLY